MHLARTLTASCIIALVTGCTTAPKSGPTASADENIVVTAQRAGEGTPTPPSAPPPWV